MRKLIISLAMAACTLPGWCYDFSYEGIMYSVIDADARTCRTKRLLELSEHLVIPDSARFGSMAFAVTEIGDASLKNKPFKSVSLPSSITSIATAAFSGCDALQSIDLPESLVSIGDEAFSGCASLLSIALPEKLVSIGDKAFSGCASLVSILVPEGVDKIGNGCFSECKSLNWIEVSSANTQYCSVDGVLFNKDMTLLLGYPCTKEGSYTVPSTIKEIGAYTFCNHQYLNDIQLPDSLKVIGREAFSGCELLESVTLPNGLLKIESEAFYKCKRLTEAILPLTLEQLGRGAFANCNIRKAFIPQGVRMIISTFRENPELDTVWICGEFDEVYIPFGKRASDSDSSTMSIRTIYYLSDAPQEDNGWWEERTYSEGGHPIEYYEYVAGSIYWGFVPHRHSDGYIPPKHPATLYVLESVYNDIKDGEMFPWSYFEHIEVYDPEKDPAPDAVDQMSSDSDTTGHVSVYTMSGTKIADSTDNLPAGLYIVRRGPKTEKIVVR